MQRENQMYVHFACVTTNYALALTSTLPGVGYVIPDGAKKGAYDEAMKGVDYCVHTAGCWGWKNTQTVTAPTCREIYLGSLPSLTSSLAVRSCQLPIIASPDLKAREYERVKEERWRREGKECPVMPYPPHRRNNKAALPAASTRQR